MTENYTPQEGELVLVGDQLTELQPRIFIKEEKKVFIQLNVLRMLIILQLLLEMI